MSTHQIVAGHAGAAAVPGTFDLVHAVVAGDLGVTDGRLVDVGVRGNETRNELAHRRPRSLHRSSECDEDVFGIVYLTRLRLALSAEIVARIRRAIGAGEASAVDERATVGTIDCVRDSSDRHWTERRHRRHLTVRSAAGVDQED